MAVSATPVVLAPSHTQHSRKASASQVPPPAPPPLSRPTTPLRSASRTSLRASQTTPSGSIGTGTAYASTQLAGRGGSSSAVEYNNDFPLAALEPAFAELSDSMADLEANFMHLQLLNESVARFNENFAAFLYGLNMTAFCVDFPEAPILQSFIRHGSNTCQLDQSPYRHNRLEPKDDQQAIGVQHDAGHDATFLTTDTSFVVNPPAKSTDSKSSARMPAKSSGSTASRRGLSSVPGRGRGRGALTAPVVAGTDANGRRITRLPAGTSRGSTRGVVRGRGAGPGR